jgi:peptidyl-prolyl cis-trans isomerase D
MLKFFSRLEKTRNFVLFLFAFVMIASLVLFYAPSDNQSIVSSNNTETAAKVGSDTVTLGEVSRVKDMYSRFMQGRSQPAKTIIDGLIREKIVTQEAKRMGFDTSDEELRNKIREQFTPTDGKPFDQKRYEQNAVDQAGSIAKFEQNFRDGMTSEKLQAFVTSSVNVSEAEVLEDFKKRNTKLDLSYVAVNSEEIAKTLKPSDEELKTYFNNNKQTYYISVPQKKIRYLFINQAKVGEKLVIPDNEIKAEYDALTIDKKQAGVQVQQIVLKVAKPELDAQVLAKANQIVEEIRTKDGGKISEEAFGEKAKGQSEDPKTAQNGGKIAGLVRQNPNNPTDPLQKTLTMEVGTVTEPTKFGNAYYIFRRGEPVAKPLEDAKKEIEVSLRNRRAYTAAAELAQKATDRLKELKDVQKVAEEFASQANMSTKDMVRETGFVKPNDDVPNIGNSPQFEAGIEPLKETNDVGDKTPIKDGFAIPLLLEKREPRDAEFDEVKEQVAESVKAEQSKTKVEEIAKQIAEGASSASALSGVASGKGAKAEESKAFTVGMPLGKGATSTTSKALEDAIAALKVGEVTKTPIKAGENWYIVGVTNREEAKMEEFTKQRDQLLQSSLQQKRGQVFQDYLADIRKKMETAGQIKIYDEILKKADGEDTAVPPPTGLAQ